MSERHNPYAPRNPEQSRLLETKESAIPWRKWGPYLSERQWGTVREDYSAGGDAWNYFSHDQARSRAYRWGEDGLGGISDDKQRLCFALALWNGKDAILKERLFGLTNNEGNHGEDVKEYYFYLDSTPTHSYMKFLYKYPQNTFPYDDLVQTNRCRNRHEMEYELLDTGIFNNDRYFDVFMEYAKSGPDDILIRITAVNRSTEAAELHVLPTLWFRNDWATWISRHGNKPTLMEVGGPPNVKTVAARHAALGDYNFYCEGDVPLLFTDNETNYDRLFPDKHNLDPYVKDGINNCVVQQNKAAVNRDQMGTKVAAHYKLKVEGSQSVSLRVRLTKQNLPGNRAPFADFNETFALRIREADEFYRSVIPPNLSPDGANVIRQALAGMLWSKQYYFIDAHKWLEEHKTLFPGEERSRNREWSHMINEDILSMPDKWEYPWYAAWDLAFHTIALAMVDPDFAKTQMSRMFHGFYLNPNGQIPAYEWNFSDVNPPVHAWATLFLIHTERAARGEIDFKFLQSVFNKLLLNFTWWVNRKDRSGKNVFEGGFLGLDNIGVFDRSSPLPTGGYLEQADGTSWMAFFSQNMVELAVELAAHDPIYDDMAFKFVEHFYTIAKGMNQPGCGGMWDEADGFYYDVLRLPDGTATRLKVRSMVGLLPLCATSVIEDWQRELVPNTMEGIKTRVRQRPEILDSIHPTGEGNLGVADRGILALVNPDRLRRILSKMLDENEFLSPYGIRSLSKFHEKNPYVFNYAGKEYRVDYIPAESNNGMFGGNSNWRGPVWMPVNALLIRALLQFYAYYGDNFKVECPTGSGKMMNLFEVSKEIADRLCSIFLKDKNGRRPNYGGTEKFQADPHWKDCILFYEYFHGDNGAGLGASHQTGWTGLVAKIMQLYCVVQPEKILASGRKAVFQPNSQEHVVTQTTSDCVKLVPEGASAV